MKFIIIGLGGFGRELAIKLTDLGHEIIGVDTNEKWVDDMKEKISGAFILDATDDKALDVLPLNDVDNIVVAVGNEFGTSIKIVSLLKNRKLKTKIYARSYDDIHTSVLSALGIENILRPEIEAARLYADQLTCSNK